MFPPAILNCRVTDGRAVDALEHLIANVSTAFTCQTQKDWDTLFSLVLGRNKKRLEHLKLRNISLKVCETSLHDQPQPRATRDEVSPLLHRAMMVLIDGIDPQTWL